MIASQVLERQMEQVQQYLSDFHADHLAVRLVTLSFASALSAKKMMALRKGSAGNRRTVTWMAAARRCRSSLLF